jgi:hypothetical protein
VQHLLEYFWYSHEQHPAAVKCKAVCAGTYVHRTNKPTNSCLHLLLQNLMNAALHGSGQALVGNIRRVLGELHRSKRLGGAGSVDAMLVRLYEPILFRALSATNAGVRRNALQLLLDAFPLLVSVTEGALDESHVHAVACLLTCMRPCWPLLQCTIGANSCQLQRYQIAEQCDPPIHVLPSFSLLSFNPVHSCFQPPIHVDPSCALLFLNPVTSLLPLQDPEASTEEQDELLVRQFQALSDGLTLVLKRPVMLLLPLQDPEASTEEQDELLVCQFQALSDGLTLVLLHPVMSLLPLQDPEASTEEQDELLVRQFQALSDGLTLVLIHPVMSLLPLQDPEASTEEQDELLVRQFQALSDGLALVSIHPVMSLLPLQDPEASTEEQDELLVRQFQALSDGLTDACPSVRVVAAQGICGVLNLYWEIIPSATTAGFVSRLTSEGRLEMGSSAHAVVEAHSSAAAWYMQRYLDMPILLLDK